MRHEKSGDPQMSMISIELDRDQAEALLTALRRIGPSEVAMLHEGVEWAAFDKASSELCTALQEFLEAGWCDKEGAMTDKSTVIRDAYEEARREQSRADPIPLWPLPAWEKLPREIRDLMISIFYAGRLDALKEEDSKRFKP